MKAKLTKRSVDKCAKRAGSRSNMNKWKLAFAKCLINAAMKR